MFLYTVHQQLKDISSVHNVVVTHDHGVIIPYVGVTQRWKNFCNGTLILRYPIYPERLVLHV